MNQFENYKKSLEDYLQSVEFIYSGDIISSTNLRMSEKLQHTSFSANLFRQMMIEIYNISVKKMFEKSTDIVIHRNNFVDTYQLINNLGISGFHSKIIFFSNNSNKNLNLGGNTILQEPDDGHSFLPIYFARQFKMMAYGVDVSCFFCPIIEDSVDDCQFYIVDKPIQSMVWSLQNIDYSINKSFSMNEHQIKIPIYDCDYNVYRVRVIDTQKLREDKINSILNDN